MANELVVPKSRSSSPICQALKAHRSLSAAVRNTFSNSYSELVSPEMRKSLRLITATSRVPLTSPSIKPEKCLVTHKHNHSEPLKNFKGFKTYNRLKKYMQLCAELMTSIETLKSRRTNILPDILEQVEESLDLMTKEESEYFKLLDKSNEYEQKMKEIQRLKQRIDKCARNSMCLLQEQFMSTAGNRFSEPDSKKLKFNGVNSRDFRIAVQTIDIYMSNQQQFEDDKFVEDAGFNIDEDIHQVHELISSIQEMRSIYKWFNAEYYLISLQEQYQRLTDVEEYYTESLIRNQAGAKYLIDITKEVDRYRAILSRETADLRAKLKTQDLERAVEEEDKLFDFVNLARNIYLEEQEEKRKREVKTMSKLLPPMPDKALPVEKQPVWLRAWVPGKRLSLLHAKRHQQN